MKVGYIVLDSYYVDGETYFSFLEKKCVDKQLKRDYPLVIKELENLVQLIKKISIISSQNFFNIHAEILGIDSRIKILLTFLDFGYSDFSDYLTEEQIINMSLSDYKIFMKEQYDSKVVELFPTSLYLSII